MPRTRRGQKRNIKDRYLAAIFIAIFSFTRHILCLPYGREPMFTELNYPLAKSKSFPRQTALSIQLKQYSLISLISFPLFLPARMLNQRTSFLFFRSLATDRVSGSEKRGQKSRLVTHVLSLIHGHAPLMKGTFHLQWS